jgi:hypothetical protein
MVSSEEIAETFQYKNGTVYWKCDRGTNIKAGAIAGSKKSNRGYVKIGYKGKHYTRRIELFGVFAMENGRPNKLQIDHINHMFETITELKI